MLPAHAHALQYTTYGSYGTLSRFCLKVLDRPGGGTPSTCTSYLKSYLYKVGEGRVE
jgi:hypothetical protein